MSKFSLKHTQAGFSFNLVADNGQVVAASQVYAAKDNCLKGIGSVQANAPFAPVEDQTDHRGQPGLQGEGLLPERH